MTQCTANYRLVLQAVFCQQAIEPLFDTRGAIVSATSSFDHDVYYSKFSFPAGTAGESDTHSLALGYVFWLIGFTGAHRFYYGKTKTGVLWFFTLGLLGVGWIVDFFLIPGMEEDVAGEYQEGPIDYNLCWVLLIFTGCFGAHRLYQEKYVTGIIYLLTGGLLGLGVVADVLTLNEQISDENMNRTYVI